MDKFIAFAAWLFILLAVNCMFLILTLGLAVLAAAVIYYAVTLFIQLPKEWLYLALGVLVLLVIWREHRAQTARDRASLNQE